MVRCTKQHPSLYKTFNRANCSGRIGNGVNLLPIFFMLVLDLGPAGYRSSFLQHQESEQLFALTAGRRSCLERAVPAEIVRSCAWRQKKEPRNIWKGNSRLFSNQHSCLGVGNIINIVLIAIYVKRKKIKKSC